VTDATDDPWVLLDEMAEWDDLGPMGLALFRGSVFSRSERQLEYVEGLTLDDALAWARERAPRVEVRLTGFNANSYSAGSEPTSAPAIETAPRIVRRRPAGWEFLDRTEAADPIAWDVVIDADRVTLNLLATEGSGTAGRSWREAINATPGCQVQLMRGKPATPPTEGSPGAWTAHTHDRLAVLRVQARTAKAAMDTAADAALTAARKFGVTGDASLHATGAYAASSRAAHLNARL
jgi:hypothetical protein